MKYTLVVGLVILFFTSVSHAQITGTINQVVSPVRPIIDRTPSDLKALREQAVRRAQSAVNSTETLASGMLDSIPTPQFRASSATTILSTSGQPVIKEVTVENGFLAVEKEWLFLGSEADKAHFDGANIELQRAQYLPSLSQWLYQVRVTGNADEVSAISNSLPEKLQSQLGRNHIYLSQSQRAVKNVENNAAKSFNTASPQAKVDTVCQTPLRIGMVDTHVSPDHPLLSHIRLTQETFIIGHNQNNKAIKSNNANKAENGEKASTVAFSSDHGTAVASLLAKSIPASSQVFNASVFYSRNSVSQGATLMSLIEGLNFLASQQVDAINMSLAGPDNPVLASVIKQLDEKGVQIIAAVGNEGPASLPLYPAAYPETLGITAVDKNHAIYRWANQGSYVDFASYGVSVDAAHPKGDTVRQTGTSMAAPRATALYACFLRAEKERKGALIKLQHLAVDAGEPGRDSIFGFGVLP